MISLLLLHVNFRPGEPPPLLQLPHNDEEALPPLVRCSRHMCPIRVHWHVKLSYKEYWRVKITITNLNIVKNFSQWNLVVLHPSLRSVSQVFSFNYKPLNQYGHISKFDTTNSFAFFFSFIYFNCLQQSATRPIKLMLGYMNFMD